MINIGKRDFGKFFYRLVHMDKVFYDSPANYDMSKRRYRPYLCELERLAFKRTDQRVLYDSITTTRDRKGRERAKPASFIVHVPFNEREHSLVLEHLTLYRFLDLTRPLHALPFQLIRDMRPKDAEGINDERTMCRDCNGILSYVSELVLRESSLWNEGDEVLELNPRGPEFPKVRFVDKPISLVEQLRVVNMETASVDFVDLQWIAGYVILVKMVGASPMLLSLNKRGNRGRPKLTAPARFLITERSELKVTDTSPIVVSDGMRFICVYESEMLAFFDLQAPNKFRYQQTEIKSFKSMRFPCKGDLSLLCAKKAEEPGPVSMLIAAKKTRGLRVWCYTISDGTLKKSKLALSPVVLRWISGDRLAAVTEGNDVLVVKYPWNVEKPGTRLFTMECEKRYVECQGDALVLVSTSTTGPRRAKVITFDGELRESVVDLENDIVLCAYSQNSFVASMPDGRVFIWDLHNLQIPQIMIYHRDIRMIQPITHTSALFLLVHQRNTGQFFDEYGNKSAAISQPVVNAKFVYYVPNGTFSVMVTESLDLITTWFTE